MKLQWKKIFLIGLGFFTITLAWAVYNAYVPVFLEKLIKNSTLIGLIMTFDNIFGVILQPFFGSLSDKTNNKLGRRMPYLIFGIPMAALFFFIIPFHTGIITLMLAVIGMNLFMSIYRAPAVALMPDCTPSRHRSKANGIINFMGGIGAVLALIVGGKLYNINDKYPFMGASILMIIALVILIIFFKERRKPRLDKYDEAKMDVKMINFKKPKESYIIHNPNLLLMLFAIFFWFFGYFGIESFFSLYAKDSLGLGAGDASQMLAYMAGTFLATAIPAGFLGARLGRKVTMLTGLLLMIISFVIIFLFPEVTIIKIMFIVSGCGWALININSYPSIIELAPEGHIGQYTGLYYAFSFTASILSPILFGFISDLVGNYRMIFLSADISFIIALFFFLPTKRLDGVKNDIA